MSGQIGGLSFEQAEAALTPWKERAAPIGAEEYQHRLEQARRLMRERGDEALLITAGASLRYFTGISWGASERLVAMLLTLEGDPFVLCPAFEEGSLQHALKISAITRLWEEHEDPQQQVADLVAAHRVRRLALDPAATFLIYGRLRTVLGACELVDGSPIVDGCRMQKSAAELALMRQATAMTLQVHRLAAGLMHEGIGIGEVRRFIDRAHRALGADGGSTFCIVQFGHATAYPHGIPGEQQLRPNELVLIDTGCSVEGYQSDITRTYVFGEPSVVQARIWSLEQAAQRAAFDTVRPGVACAEVDAAARRILEAAGLGPNYRLPGLPHRTGHGCGLSIHETPYLVRGNETALAPGMCCSDEPMIVVPGEFGIRLEDHFHVTEDGAQWFTEPSPAIDVPFASA
ncbi:Xaa-Pro dipeptidase [Rhodanobacter sp. ANJX3]|uniref:M24 family metallopeptidase n=1 Tax=Rhodanobacter sp. ANJX3 TaxID=2723083 RepID=UPI001621F7DE|nr:Xaa-Pro peptidase family protein [Rhodanobacter sp. ANJX3]MBB5356942.1 Xaa-Pro dipeptidase [Rhodanobacter sp. ANJX3]